MPKGGGGGGGGNGGGGGGSGPKKPKKRNKNWRFSRPMPYGLAMRIPNIVVKVPPRQSPLPMHPGAYGLTGPNYVFGDKTAATPSSLGIILHLP